MDLDRLPALLHQASPLVFAQSGELVYGYPGGGWLQLAECDLENSWAPRPHDVRRSNSRDVRGTRPSWVGAGGRIRTKTGTFAYKRSPKMKHGGKAILGSRLEHVSVLGLASPSSQDHLSVLRVCACACEVFIGQRLLACWGELRVTARTYDALEVTWPGLHQVRGSSRGGVDGDGGVSVAGWGGSGLVLGGG